MKRLLSVLVLALSCSLLAVNVAQAQQTDLLGEILDASPGATATEEGSLASASAQAQQQLQEKKDQDLTETGGKQKDKLAAFLDEHPIGELAWHNPLQQAIRQAVANGLPANIIVLLLLFPVITSLIAFARHVVGLKGFGVFIPAVLSVAFVSTGIPTGVVVFIVVLLAATIAKFSVKRLRLPLLPRTAMLLWVVSVLFTLVLIGSSWFGVASLLTLNIFPILIVMLITENFISTQLFNSQKEALSTTFETLLIAVLCAFLINMEPLQQWVLLYPEISLIAVAIFNLIVGRHTGLRLLEKVRFQSIIEEE
jgi:hypothetical protein